MKIILNEGNQIHNFKSGCGSGTVINYGSGSDFLTNYGSGSGSTSQKVTVPMVLVPVPVPQHSQSQIHLVRQSLQVRRTNLDFKKFKKQKTELFQ
jgi:hypothetical protein